MHTSLTPYKNSFVAHLNDGNAIVAIVITPDGLLAHLAHDGPVSKSQVKIIRELLLGEGFKDLAQKAHR